MTTDRPAWTWRHAVAESDLKSTTKLVLFTLSLHMSPAGENCYPSIARIARESSLTRKAVRQHLQNAVDAGWLLISKRRTKEGDQDTNLYDPKYPNTTGGVSRHPPLERHSLGVGDDVTHPGNEGAHGGLPDDGGVGYHGAPNISLELSNEIDAAASLFADDAQPVQIDEVRLAYESYCAACDAAGRPERKPIKLTEQRRKHTAARLSTYGSKAWSLVMQKLSDPTCWLWTWKNFEYGWLVKNDDNFAKVIEGKYDGGGQPVLAPFDPGSHDWRSSNPIPESEMRRPEVMWRWRIGQWYGRGFWPEKDWGPGPGAEGCRAPASILHEMHERYGKREAAE